MTAPLVGIFVGGLSSRMGRVPKGLLMAPETGESLVERLARVCFEALPGCQVCLVGASDAYAKLRFDVLSDQPEGVGPIGGLAALLVRSGVHQRQAIALACDLPFVSAALIARLATHGPDALAVAPRPDGIWQPLCARYAPGALEVTERVIASGRRALHAVLDELGPQAVELPLAPGERGLVADWDEPDDVRRNE